MPRQQKWRALARANPCVVARVCGVVLIDRFTSGDKMKETIELNVLLAMLNKDEARAKELLATMTPSELTALGMALARLTRLLNAALREREI